MKLIKPSFEIIQCPAGEESLYYIERAARTCYKSEGKIDVSMFQSTIYANDDPASEEKIVKNIILKATSARELVSKLIARGHDAMIEFGGLLHVLFVIDRGVSHELVRHRLASFAQESTRYCNYGKEDSITFIIPNWINCPENLINIHLTDDVYSSYICDTEDHDENFLHWSLAVNSSENFYLAAINELKWTPQEARSVLPNFVKTEINVSANLREWRHIFKQRCSPAAHPQMREVMIPLLQEMQSRIPLIFDDIKI